MVDESWLARLGQSLIGRRVKIAPPPGHAEHAPAAEQETEDQHPDPVPGASAAWSAFITYEDSAGEPSGRVITIRSIKGHYGRPEVIGAHCHLRDQHRTFRVDRITGMACAATGLELDPLENCLALHRTGALQIEDLVLTRVMRVLVFLGRCDGEFHPLERAELDDITGQYMRHFGGDDAAYDCVIKQAPRLAPSAEDLVRDLRWLTKAPNAPELARFMLRSSGRLVCADGQIANEETSWMIDVEDALKRVAAR